MGMLRRFDDMHETAAAGNTSFERTLWALVESRVVEVTVYQYLLPRQFVTCVLCYLLWKTNSLSLLNGITAMARGHRREVREYVYVGHGYGGRRWLSKWSK